MYTEENCKSNIEVGTPITLKELELLKNDIECIVDIIANRVSDFRSINDKLFGSIPPSLETNGTKEVSGFGAIYELKERMDTLRYYSSQLMPEVRRLENLI